MNAMGRPTTLFGFLAGLVTGLVIAVVIALYLTNSPVPFVNKVQRSTENITPDTADPNHSLFSPQIPSPSAEQAGRAVPSAPAAAETRSATGAPPGAAAAPGTAAPGNAAGAGVSANDAAGNPASDGGNRQMLQVGAYKSGDDADAVRARLALLGLDAKVTAVQSDGATLYRVRLGPYGALDDLNGI